MFTLICELESTSPLSFSRPIVKTKKVGEKPVDWEDRCWKERLHKTKKGQLYIPAMAFKLAMDNATAGIKIPGERNATYTKVVKGGVMVFKDMLLNATENDITCEELLVPSNGVRGNGTRVVKKFPTLDKPWVGTLEIEVVNPKLNEKEIIRFLEYAGRFVGLLRWRPQNGGLYGRFRVNDYKVKK